MEDVTLVADMEEEEEEVELEEVEKPDPEELDSVEGEGEGGFDVMVAIRKRQAMLQKESAHLSIASLVP